MQYSSLVSRSESYKDILGDMEDILQAYVDLAVCAGWTRDRMNVAMDDAILSSCERLGLKREELAEILGISPRTLRSWKRGASKPADDPREESAHQRVDLFCEHARRFIRIAMNLGKKMPSRAEAVPGETRPTEEPRRG
jgi:Helix-turn-helix